MTSNIIIFPGKPTRDWASAEKQIKQALSECGLSVALQERVITGLQDFCQLLSSLAFDFSADITFPGSISRNQVNAISEDIGTKVSALLTNQFHEFTIKLITERINREIQGCRDLGLL